MPRVKRGTKRRAKRKKYLKRTKGFFLTKSNLYQPAQEAANRADRYAKRDRRVKKRQYRRLWIQRVGAAARQNNLTYGQLINGMKVAGILIDRKVLADIAVKDAAAFAQIAEQARSENPPQTKKQKQKKEGGLRIPGSRRLFSSALGRLFRNRAPALYPCLRHAHFRFQALSVACRARRPLRRTGSVAFLRSSPGFRF